MDIHKVKVIALNAKCPLLVRIAGINVQSGKLQAAQQMLLFFFLRHEHKHVLAGSLHQVLFTGKLF
jgi:hypothetical protein